MEKPGLLRYGDHRLYLNAVQRRFYGLGDLGEIRDHGKGLGGAVVLKYRDEVEVPVVPEYAYVLRGAGKRVVGGHCDHYRALVAQVAFYCHADRCSRFGKIKVGRKENVG